MSRKTTVSMNTKQNRYKTSMGIIDNISYIVDLIIEFMVIYKGIFLLSLFLTWVFIFMLYGYINKKLKIKFPEYYENVTDTNKILIPPPSLTEIITTTEDPFDIDNIKGDISEYLGNKLQYPSFFHVNEKWPGSLPRPLYQGSCGSCWGFSVATTLSSRFYIETCGVGGCQNYPQVNFGSLDAVNGNLNKLYKFRNLYLSDAFKDIDLNKDNYISREEWMEIVKKYLSIYLSKGSPLNDKYYVAQILVYILNFQSLGSINLDSEPAVLERANRAFDGWLDFTESFQKIDLSSKKHIFITSDTKTSELNGSKGYSIEPGRLEENSDRKLDISLLQNAWANEPITLSAEKIISCCSKCMPLDFNGKELDNISCSGSTLYDAWSMVRESGTPSAMCIGYNLDNYTKGDPLPNCRDLQGPYYSFCSGHYIDRRSGETAEEWSKNMTERIDSFENGPIDPVAIPNSDQNLPWTNPQLFRFRPKNVYKVNKDYRLIQKEILERGPVSAGFMVYESFQNKFAKIGQGGHLFKKDKSNPIGCDIDSLIYAHDPSDKTDKLLYGHAITIIGWGTYNYLGKLIPYWICLNSWGMDWGTSGLSPFKNRTGEPSDLKKGGFFWILRGYNNCFIEDNVYAGQPDLDNISYPGTVDKYGWGINPPNLSEVTFIEQKSEPIIVDVSTILEYSKLESGGGIYSGRTIRLIGDKDVNVYYLKSMKSPSPYTLFWPDYRPIYCLGPTFNEFSSMSTNDVIDVSEETKRLFIEIKKHQRNPLLILDGEQLQLLDYIDKNLFRVYRGVNNSNISYHNIGTEIQIIPYKDLSVDILDSITSKCILE